jgi:hypothetical protein
MRRAVWISAAACAAAIAIGGTHLRGADGQDNDGRSDDRGCSEVTIRGDYGIQFEGFRPAPSPTDPARMETVIGVVHRTYDGFGNITQVDNVKGFYSGIPMPNRPGVGTYQVDADCTGTATFQPGPNLPTLIERLVIVRDGREIRTITASPATVMVTGVQQRIHTR